MQPTHVSASNPPISERPKGRKSTPFPHEVPEHVHLMVESAFGIPRKSYMVTRRHHTVVLCRMLVIAVLREHYAWSLAAIANAMERDHTTVIHMLKRHADIVFTQTKDPIDQRYVVAYGTVSDMIDRRKAAMFQRAMEAA